jgi:uncharacterized protein
MAQSAKTSNRGFASMDAQKQKEIASKGGRAAHQQGTAHEFTPEEAREAGRKGGLAVSRDRAHMSQIGREGGTARAHRRATQMRIAPEQGNEGQNTSENMPPQNQSGNQDSSAQNSGQDSQNP